MLALSLLSGALLVALLALTLSRSQSKSLTPEARPGASSLPLPSAPPALAGCRLLLPAARLAESVERSVPPYATKLDGVGELALGIAESKTKGRGLRVDSNTLDVSPVFEEDGKDAVRGVVPLTRSGSLTFFVDRDDRALRSAHTIDEVPPFTLGVSDAGFSRVVAGSASLVWQLDSSVKITEPRSAPLADYGYGVTFRRGGQSGAVLLGFVARDGQKKSELAEVPGAPKFLGTPVIAGSRAGALIAFAGRDAADTAWKLFVSLTKPGEPPSPARELTAGSGGGAISPTLAALSDDRWLVQWTEGSSAQYHVHVQSFSADLSPIGQSLAVSPKGANAGQGALVTFCRRRGHALHSDHRRPRRTLGSNARMYRRRSVMMAKTRSCVAVALFGLGIVSASLGGLRGVRLEPRVDRRPGQVLRFRRSILRPVFRRSVPAPGRDGGSPEGSRSRASALGPTVPARAASDPGDDRAAPPRKKR